MTRLSLAAKLRGRALLALPLVLLTAASATSQTYSIAPGGQRPLAAGDVSHVALPRAPKALLADHRALEAALAALRPGRAGVPDAFVVVAALDSDRVFGREAQEAARVLARRYGAAGRTVVLTSEGAPASPATLAIALARIGELADADEDSLVLYTTSHGTAPEGLAYRDAGRGAGTISPARLAAILDGAGLPNRLLILSACYSGIFVPRLAADRTVVITAAAADRSSFGCDPGNDWTFFGDALINRALRKNQPIADAFAQARESVGAWEAAGKLEPSNPRISIGRDAARWLAPLEARIPAAATAPVGRSPAAGVFR
ncbi:MAG TPA: C13 family peptidase [Sphingomonadaceae bacterium]|nr:C13 family peptidase [Sphingomonadaceae bacterium]